MSQLSLIGSRMSVRVSAIIVGAIFTHVFAAEAMAQPYNGSGPGTGTSSILLPSTATIPSSHFRAQGSIHQIQRASQHNSTVIDVTGGFSGYLEAFFTVSMESAGGEADNDLFGVGAKFRIPDNALFGIESALWWETARGGLYEGATFETSSLTRTGLVVNIGMDDLALMVTGGVTIDGTRIRPLAGVAGMYPAASSLLLSGELSRGYNGTDTYMLLLGGAVRLLPHVSLQVSPGYAWKGPTGGLTLLAGLCISTAVMDFLPVAVKEEGSDIPSIEEIEGLLKGE